MGYDLTIYNQNSSDNEYNPYAVIVNSCQGTSEPLVPVFLTNENKLFYPLTKYGIGQGFHYDAEKNEIAARERRWGDFWDDNFSGGDFSIHTITVGGEETHYLHNLSKKEYWFFYNGEEFYEYIGQDIPIDSFKIINGGDEAIKLIADKNGEIT